MKCRAAAERGRPSVGRLAAAGYGCTMETRPATERRSAMKGWRAMERRFTVEYSCTSVDRRGCRSETPGSAERRVAPRGPRVCAAKG